MEWLAWEYASVKRSWIEEEIGRTMRENIVYRHQNIISIWYYDSLNKTKHLDWIWINNAHTNQRLGAEVFFSLLLLMWADFTHI